ncbi:MAG: DUF3078 domain-containing protein [Saprospiraceae bacterium]
MRLKFTVLALLLTSISLFAQENTDESNWKIGGDAGLTFFQSSFVNWTDGGGDPTTTIGILGNLYAKYGQDRTSWENIALLQYQIQRVGADADFLKSIDRLELLSVAGYQISENNANWNYSMLASMKTQLTNTVVDDKLQSNFFAPAEILLAPGVKFTRGDKKTKDNLLVNLSPATAKFTIVNDADLADAGTFTGIPATYDTSGNKLTDGSMLRSEFGASLIANYRLNVVDKEDIKVSWQTNVELFSNYLENPQNVDVKWTNLIATNFLKYFTVTVSTDLRYDYDVQIPSDVDENGTIETGEFIRGVRFAQTFGVGIGYKF